MNPFVLKLTRTCFVGIWILIAFSPGLAASGSGAKPVPVQASRRDFADETALQGEWRGIQAEWNGEKLAPADVTQFELTIKGDAIALADARNEYSVLLHDFAGIPRARFRVDHKSSPLTIDVIVDNGIDKGSSSAEISRWKNQHFIYWSRPGLGKPAAIYSVRDGKLTVCWPGQGATASPKAFKTLPGDQQLLVVFERIKANTQGQTFRQQFVTILRAWRTAAAQFDTNYKNAKMLGEKRGLATEHAATANTLAWQCVPLVRANPTAPEAVTALCWCVGHAARHDAGKAAIAMLQNGVIAQAEPDQLAEALDLCGGHEGKELAPAVLDMAKRHLEHPRAARLLTWVCVASHGDASAQVPPTFAEATTLIVGRFADNPDITNFCWCLGSDDFASPPWATKYEHDLRTILVRNRSRHVRGTASFALASIAEAGGRARRDEAIRLYEAFLKDFDGSDPSTNEENMRVIAQFRLDQIRLRALGMVAPELRGHDLDGKALKLSDYRGKVVLLSFWSTGCVPCLEFASAESVLAQRLRDKPFAILGVTSDPDSAPIKEIATMHQMTWRILRPNSGEAWSLEGVPTLYLIDDSGTIRRYWCGAPKSEELDKAADELVQAAIGKRSAPSSPAK
jgi:uncharacterized protein (TIGR03067 family)